MAQGVLGSLRPRIILTFRHYKGGRSPANRIGCLYPRRNPWYSLSEAESTSVYMILSGVTRKKTPVTPPGIDPWTVRLLAQRLNHYATPGPNPAYTQPNLTMFFLFGTPSSKTQTHYYEYSILFISMYCSHGC